MAEKPTLRRAAHSTIPAAMAPDCEINAKSPRRADLAAKVALNFAGGTITPRQFGPTRRRPLARAAFSHACATEPGPCPRPAVMMMAAAAPLFAAWATTAGTSG